MQKKLDINGFDLPGMITCFCGLILLLTSILLLLGLGLDLSINDGEHLGILGIGALLSGIFSFLLIQLSLNIALTQMPKWSPDQKSKSSGKQQKKISSAQKAKSHLQATKKAGTKVQQNRKETSTEHQSISVKNSSNEFSEPGYTRFGKIKSKRSQEIASEFWLVKQMNRAREMKLEVTVWVSAFGISSVLWLGGGPLLAVVPCVLAAVFYGRKQLIKAKRPASIRKQFIAPIIKEVAPRVRYYPNRKVSKRAFEKAGFLPEKNKQYLGSDLFVGELGESQFAVSKLKILNEAQTYIFDGWFFAFKLPQSIQGEVSIIPRKTHLRTPPDWMEQIIRSRSYRSSKDIKTQSLPSGDPEFDLSFRVEGVNEELCDAMFKKNIVETLLRTRKEYGTPLIKFSDDYLYVALEKPGGIFASRSKKQNKIDYERAAADLLFILEFARKMGDISKNMKFEQRHYASVIPLAFGAKTASPGLRSL